MLTKKQFMDLEVGDGVVFEQYIATVTKITDIRQNEVLDGFKALYQIREVEISFANTTGRLETRWLRVFLKYPEDEVHNSITLNQLSPWDPFGIIDY